MQNCRYKSQSLYDLNSSVNLLQALALVEEETRRYRPTKNYLDILPPANYAAFEVGLRDE